MNVKLIFLIRPPTSGNELRRGRKCRHLEQSASTSGNPGTGGLTGCAKGVFINEFSDALAPATSSTSSWSFSTTTEKKRDGHSAPRPLNHKDHGAKSARASISSASAFMAGILVGNP